MRWVDDEARNKLKTIAVFTTLVVGLAVLGKCFPETRLLSLAVVVALLWDV